MNQKFFDFDDMPAEDFGSSQDDGLDLSQAGDEVAYEDNGDFAANELAILKERDKEFVGEGKRWFDLLRLMDANKQPLVFSAEASYQIGGDIAPVLDKATESYKILWPIEDGLINTDPLLKQTVNYPTIH